MSSRAAHVVLGDIEPYRDWLTREHPSDAATRVAAQFVAVLSDEPWAAPSVPHDMAGQPVSEIRTVNLPVPGEPDVRIRYQHTYADKRVDLLAITDRR